MRSQIGSSKLTALAADLSGDDLVRAINDRLRRIDGMVRSQASAASSSTATVSGSGGAVTLLDLNITAVTVVTSPLATIDDGAILCVIIQQDATGYAVTWSSDFIYAANVPTTANTITTALFFGARGKWWNINIAGRMKP